MRRQPAAALVRHEHEHPRALADAESALTAATAAAAALSAALARVDALDERACAALALDILQPQLVEAASSLAAARQASLDAQAEHLALLQRHLEGIASVLAAQLVDGAPCRVCGGPRAPGARAGSRGRRLRRRGRGRPTPSTRQRCRATTTCTPPTTRCSVAAPELVAVGGDVDKAELLADLEVGARRRRVGAGSGLVARCPDPPP